MTTDDAWYDDDASAAHGLPVPLAWPAALNITRDHTESNTVTLLLVTPLTLAVDVVGAVVCVVASCSTYMR